MKLFSLAALLIAFSSCATTYDIGPQDLQITLRDVKIEGKPTPESRDFVRKLKKCGDPCTITFHADGVTLKSDSAWDGVVIRGLSQGFTQSLLQAAFKQ